MRHILRARRVVSLEDLQELAGASRDYSYEFLRLLMDQEVVRRLSDDGYQLIQDPVLLPEDEPKKRKLRERRVRKALAALERAEAAIAEARKELEDATVAHETRNNGGKRHDQQ
jgi:hypothetical protein